MKLESTISLQTDTGDIVDYGVLKIFNYRKKDYIAITPVSMWEQNDRDIYLYQIHFFKDQSFELLDIESDDLFEEVMMVFESLWEE